MGFDKKYFNFAAVFLAIILAVSGTYFVWDRFFSEEGRARRFLEEQARVYEEKEQAYIEAMAADTYGGKTPQETLDLFVSALEKSDIELASKYFLLDENLSREKWNQYLLKVKSDGLLKDMATDFQTAVFYKSLYEGNQQFVIYNQDKTDSLIVNLRFNTYSNVWKIESL